MTRANTEQQKHTPWFAKAGAACSIVPISRAVGPNAFALQGGGYAVLFSAQGTDPESLTDQELEAKVRGLEGAQRMVLRGQIAGVQVSKLWRFRASAIDHWIDQKQAG